ncbi:MAG: adenylate/guanylate cyclase domain-containing protein [Nitrospirota bacterium]|nr:adenylate/guanylate cyclase domain-containing protein [Nitrospirota bacterium]
MVFEHRHWQLPHLLALLGSCVLATTLPLFVDLFWPSFLEPVELWTVDQRFRLRPPLTVLDETPQRRSGSLVVIDYDDQAAREYSVGRWPWDRRVHAHVIDMLSSAGTRMVLVDLLFDHPTTDPLEDQALVDATRRAGMVFYPVVLNPDLPHENGESSPTVAAQHLLNPEVLGPTEFPAAGKLRLPLRGLVETARSLGHIQLTTDPGGVLRRIPLLYSSQDGFVPALALSALLYHLEVDPTSMQVVHGQAIHIPTRSGQGIAIPIDAHGRSWINYAGLWGTRFLHYPYSWILGLVQTAEGRAKVLSLFKDKIVVLSNLTTGVGDRVATPFERDSPASELHLHLINMLTTQQFLRDARPLEFALCLFLPIVLLTAATFAGGPVVIIPTFAILLFAYLGSIQIVFNTAGIILPAMPAILGLVLALILLLVARFVIVDRERLKFLSVLGACLPPQTIRVIQGNPELVPGLLAGRTRELTVLFADIKQFSGFCKRASPLDIQRVLREYLSAMTAILGNHGGTLDKYMGDGIMAFFGDAERDVDGKEQEEERAERHAANAVSAGLAMQKKMAELNAEWMREGQEPHLIRIGINTGEVTVGNLGTEYLWDYTVIGPEVNKAQRLEHAAEPGGLLLAERTYTLARKHGVLPHELSAQAITLKGIGTESSLYAVSPAIVAQLIKTLSLPDTKVIPSRPARTHAPQDNG